MRKPINGCVLALLIMVCIAGMWYPLMKTGALAMMQAKFSTLSASASGASDTGSSLSQLPASRQGYVELARQDAQAAGIPPELFVRQINQESGFNPNDVSPAGAEGIAQFMPATAAGLGIDPWDPVQSLRGAAQLMARYAHNYGGDYAKALAAYNGGTGTLQVAISACGAGWLSCEPAETQAYVHIILGN
jgi:soluble lytic murein transglycosylase-like protein